MSKAGVFVLKTLNSVFPKRGSHPLDLEKNNPGSYASWEFNLAKRTLEYFPADVLNLSDLSSCQVLDLCCGAGGKTVLLSEYNPAKIVGIDISSDFIKMANNFRDAKKAQNAHFLTMDAHSLDFPDNHFDFVFSFDAFEHVSNPELFLAEAKRVLKPSGKLILSFTSWGRHDGHHMADIIKLPWAHLFFSEETLLDYYRDYVDDDRYLLRAGSIDSKHIDYVNRISIKQAKELIAKSHMKVLYFETILYPGIMGLLGRLFGARYFSRIHTAVLEA